MVTETKNATVDSRKTKAQLLRELSELKKRERELLRLNNIYNLILENVPIFVGQVDKNGTYSRCQGAAIMKHDIKKCKSGCGCLYDLLPDFQQNVKRALQGEFVAFEHNGEHNGRKWWLQTYLFPDFYNEGEVINITFDITDIMLAQEDARLRQAQLLQADKMTSLGALVAGIAHEINNPNMFIEMGAGNLALFFDEVAPVLEDYFHENPRWKVGGRSYEESREKIYSIFKGLKEGSRRISKIITALKDFAKPDSGALNESVNINSVIESAVEILRNIIKKSTDHFSVDYDRSIPDCRGNYQQIEQVVINLITNACQSLTDSKQAVKVRTSCNPYRGLVQVEVMDNGCGIPEENLSRISEPFYTTKHLSGGLGIGLSITFDIVKRHNGTIRYSSKVDQGTSVIVSMPCY